MLNNDGKTELIRDDGYEDKTDSFVVTGKERGRWEDATIMRCRWSGEGLYPNHGFESDILYDAYLSLTRLSYMYNHPPYSGSPKAQSSCKRY